MNPEVSFGNRDPSTIISLLALKKTEHMKINEPSHFYDQRYLATNYYSFLKHRNKDDLSTIKSW